MNNVHDLGDDMTLAAEINDQALNGIDRDVIAFFIRLATDLGLPRSLGEIYGYLYCAPSPRSMDEVMQGLSISKGSVSQGLRQLQQLKAVRPVFPSGDRRTLYEAEISMRKLLGSFAQETLGPRLEQGEAQLDAIFGKLDTNGDGERPDHLRRRLHSLQVWHHKARRLLPWVVRLTVPRED